MPKRKRGGRFSRKGRVADELRSLAGGINLSSDQQRQLRRALDAVEEMLHVVEHDEESSDSDDESDEQRHIVAHDEDSDTESCFSLMVGTITCAHSLHHRREHFAGKQPGRGRRLGKCTRMLRPHGRHKTSAHLVASLSRVLCRKATSPKQTAKNRQTW